MLVNLYFYYICLYKRNRQNYKNEQRNTHITTPAFEPHFAKASRKRYIAAQTFVLQHIQTSACLLFLVILSIGNFYRLNLKTFFINFKFIEVSLRIKQTQNQFKTRRLKRCYLFLAEIQHFKYLQNKKTIYSSSDYSLARFLYYNLRVTALIIMAIVKPDNIKPVILEK